MECIVFFLSMVIESFAWCNNLGWYPWSLRVCSTSDQALLALKVSIETADVILTDVPLHVTWPFSLMFLNNLSFFCSFSVLIIMCLGYFFFLL